MVEKISEASTIVTLNNDAGTNDRTLLAWIDKKKKHLQEEGEPLPTIAMSPEMQIKLIIPPVSSGGLSQAETIVQRTVTSVSNAQHAYSHVLAEHEAMCQQVLFSAGNPVPVPVTTMVQGKITDEGRWAKEFNCSDIHTAKTEYAPVIISPAKTTVVLDAKSLPFIPIISVTTNPTASVEGDTLTTHTQTSPAEAASRKLRHDEPLDVRPQMSWAKLQKMTEPMQNQGPVQKKHMPASPQQLKTDSSSKTLEVDYAFQRWSGDHSVKVSMPMQTLREGTVTLLPSDTRAADALSRNMAHLARFTPELLQPRQERDQHQQQRQQQDEDQE